MNEFFDGDQNEKEDDKINIRSLVPGKEPDLLSALYLFLAVFLLLLFIGSMVQAWHLQIGMIFTEVAIILIPALWYWRRFNLNQVKFSRLSPFDSKYLPSIILLVISFWLMNMILATSMLVGLMEFGFEPIVVLEPPRTFTEYLSYLVVIAVFAGICEEVLFRGTIMPSMERYGIIPAITFSSFLFALLHGSFLNLISTFILGIVMSVLVIKTGSLWSGIIYHVLNNFIAVTYLYIAGQYEDSAEVALQDLPAALPIFSLALAGAWLGLRLLHNKSGVSSLLKYRSGWLPRGWFSWPLIVGLIVYLFVALFELAIGFNWFNLTGFS